MSNEFKLPWKPGTSPPEPGNLSALMSRQCKATINGAILPVIIVGYKDKYLKVKASDYHETFYLLDPSKIWWLDDSPEAINEVMKEFVAAKNSEKTKQLQVSIPNWYNKDQMFYHLLSNNYSLDIAKELSEKWASDNQQAFRKGFEKGHYYAIGEHVDVSIEIKESEQLKGE